MNVYYMFFDEKSDFSIYSKYIRFVSEERQKKIDRFYFQKDKLTSLLAEMLARYIISEKIKIQKDKIIIDREGKGKPYLRGVDKYHFSISHSGGCIAFVDDTDRIGVDTEKIEKCDIKIAKRFFTPEEYEIINEKENIDEEFFRVWTQKEAYLKMTGDGIGYGLNKFNVYDKEKKDMFKTYKINNYVISVCSERMLRIDDVEICKIQLNDLIKYFEIQLSELLK